MGSCDICGFDHEDLAMDPDVDAAELASDLLDQDIRNEYMRLIGDLDRPNRDRWHYEAILNVESDGREAAEGWILSARAGGDPDCIAQILHVTIERFAAAWELARARAIELAADPRP